MRTVTSTLMLIAIALVGAMPLAAQQKRLSPHETISNRIDGNRITIVYGRPYSKDPKSGEIRKIWGSLVPYGKVWRAGADEATLFITQKPILLAGGGMYLVLSSSTGFSSKRKITPFSWNDTSTRSSPSGSMPRLRLCSWPSSG